MTDLDGQEREALTAAWRKHCGTKFPYAGEAKAKALFEAGYRAFREAEKLTVERVLVNHDPVEHRERLVGPWRPSDV